MPEYNAKDSETLLKETMRMIAPEFNPLEELKKIYPYRIIETTFFNRKFLSDRRVLGAFVGIDALKNIDSTIDELFVNIDNPNGEKWADVFILYLVSHNPAHIEEAMNIIRKEPIRDSRVLIAIPQQIAGIAGTLLLFKTLNVLAENEESPEQKQDWLNKLQARQADLKKLILWDNWNWFYMGGSIEKEDNITEEGVLSIIMEKVYPDSINPGLRCLGHHRKLSKKDRQMVAEALEVIRNLDSPIIISKEGTPGSCRLLKRLGEMGLLERISHAGWEEEWEAKSEPAENSPVRKLWTELHGLLIRVQTGEEVSFQEIFELFMYPGYGTTRGFFEVVFALFWRCFHHQVNLYNTATEEKLEEDRLTSDMLDSMINAPQNWILNLRKETPQEKIYLESLKSIFPVYGGAEDKYTSLWEESKHIVVEWFERLPGIIHKESFKNQHVNDFLRTLNQHKTGDSSEIFMYHIPEALGFNPDEFDTEKDGVKISEILAEVVEEINDKTESINDRLWKEICRLLYLPKDEDKIMEALNDWLEQVNAERFSETYRGDCKILFDLITSDGEKSIKQKLLEDLPEKFGIGTVMNWEMDRVPELTARLDKAIYHISVMQFLEMKELDDTDKKKKFIAKWFAKFIRGMEFEPDELEEFLEKYLEDIA